MLMIIDGSYFMHRVVHSGKKVTNPTQTNYLVHRLIGSLQTAVLAYRPWGILFTKDAKPSWRHTSDYYDNTSDYIKELCGTEGYKGTRAKKDKDMDWDTIHKSYNIFLNIIQDIFDVTVYGSHMAEADDIMAHGARTLQAMGLDCLLFTADGDSNQSLGKLCYRLNPQTHTLFLSDDMKELVEDIDYEKRGSYKKLQRKKAGAFNLKFILDKSSKYYHPKTKDFGMYKNVLNVEFVPVWGYMLEKIITGDKGDNIHPINAWRKGTSTRVYRTPPKLIKAFIAEVAKEYKDKCDCDGKRLFANKRLIYTESFITRVINFVVLLDKSRRFDNYYRPQFTKKVKPRIIGMYNTHIPKCNIIVTYDRNGEFSGHREWFDAIPHEPLSYNIQHKKAMELLKVDVRAAYYRNRNMVMINTLEVPESVQSMLDELDFSYPQEKFRYSQKIEKAKFHLNKIEGTDVTEEEEIEEQTQEDKDAQDLLFS